MKTIKQLADEMGVNVQTIYRRIDKISKKSNEALTEKVDGITYFTDIGEKLITESLTPVKQSLNTDKQAENTEILFLREQIKELQAELKAEREHSINITGKLAELTHNSQVLQLKSQESNALLRADEQPLPPSASEKVSLWNKLFKRKN